MQIDLLLLKRMLLAIVVFMGITLPSQGQIPLTIDKAMEIAQENSPSLRRSYMNLERYKQNLYLQPIITQYFIDNKSEIWLLFLIAHSKR